MISIHCNKSGMLCYIVSVLLGMMYLSAAVDVAPDRCADPGQLPLPYCMCNYTGFDDNLPDEPKAVFGDNFPAFDVSMDPEDDVLVIDEGEEKPNLILNCTPVLTSADPFDSSKFDYSPWCIRQLYFYRNKAKLSLDEQLPGSFYSDGHREFWTLYENFNADNPTGVLSGCGKPCDQYERPVRPDAYDRFSNDSFWERFALEVIDLINIDSGDKSNKEVCCAFDMGASRYFTEARCVNITYTRKIRGGLQINISDSEKTESKRSVRSLVIAPFEEESKDLLTGEQVFIYNLTKEPHYIDVSVSVEGIYPGTGSLLLRRIGGGPGDLVTVTANPTPRGDGLFDFFAELTNRRVEYGYRFTFEAEMTYLEESTSQPIHPEVKETYRKTYSFQEDCSMKPNDCGANRRYVAVLNNDGVSWECKCQCYGDCTGDSCEIDPYECPVCDDGTECDDKKCQERTCIRVEVSTIQPTTKTTPNLVIECVSPSIGILAGGSSITVCGKHFPSNNATMYIGSYQSRSENVCSRTSCFIKTPPGKSSDVGVAMPIKLDFSMDSIMLTAFSFTYHPNPKVFSIHPLETSAAGGTTLTIKGKDFHAVSTPQLIIYIIRTTGMNRETNVATLTSPCSTPPPVGDDGVAGEFLLCPTPPLDIPVADNLSRKPRSSNRANDNTGDVEPDQRDTSPEDATTALPNPSDPVAGFEGENENGELKFYLGLILDGDDSYRDLRTVLPEYSQITVYFEPPHFDTFTETKEVSGKELLHITGERLSDGLQLSDYRVNISSASCNMMDLTANVLICELPDENTVQNVSREELDTQNNQDKQQYSVYVHPGLNLPPHFIGTVRYHDANITPTIVGIVVGVVGAVLLLIALIICLCRKYSTQNKKDEVDAAQNDKPARSENYSLEEGYLNDHMAPAQDNIQHDCMTTTQDVAVDHTTNKEHVEDGMMKLANPRGDATNDEYITMKG